MAADSIRWRKIFNRWLPFVIFALFIGAAAPCKGMAFFMKTELSDKESRQLDDITAFNESIRDGGWSLKKKIIKEKELDHLNLRDSKWYDVSVQLSSIKEASFKNCTFEKVSFDQTDMSRTRFEGCTFIACTFSSTKMMDGFYISCSFDKCRFESCELSGTNLDSTTFQALEATEVEWRHAKFESARFTNCDLKEVDITNGELLNTTFESCKIRQSGFSTNLIKDCKFEIQGEAVSFAESKVTKLTITSPGVINDLNLSGMAGSQIVVKNLQWSEMFSISMAQVEQFRLENAKLRYASITGTRFEDSIFTNVQFDYARFDRSRYTRTRFEKVEFSGEIIFDDAEFDNTEFSSIQKGKDLTVTFKNTVCESKPPF